MSGRGVPLQRHERPSRRQQVNQTEQQQRLWSAKEDHKGCQVENDGDSRPDGPTNKEYQAMTRRLNIKER